MIGNAGARGGGEAGSHQDLEGAPVAVVLDPEQPPGVRERMRELTSVQVVEPSDPKGVQHALNAGAEILATYRWREIYLQPSLRWLAGEGAGYENFPIDTFGASGIVMTTARGVHAVCVAEHAIGLLLAVTHGIGAAMRDIATKEWRARPLVELRGLTVGVLGLGSIGREVARLADALGMRVLGMKKDTKRYTSFVEEVFPPDGILDLCRRSDALIVTLPGGSATHHMVSDEALAALEGGFVVNVGRGSVVDEAALCRALLDGRILGAGLDVFQREPLPSSSKLWELRNVVISPHCAGLTPQFGERWVPVFLKNLQAFRGRGPWQNRIFTEQTP